MTDWSFDLDAVQDDDEVILALALGQDQARMLARPHWFDDGPDTRTRGWQCTVTGRRIDYARPYAWTPAPIPPDLAAEPPRNPDPQLPLDPPAEEAPVDPPPADDVDQRLPPELEDVDF